MKNSEETEKDNTVIVQLICEVTANIKKKTQKI